MNEEEIRGRDLELSIPSGGVTGARTLGQDKVWCVLDHEMSSVTGMVQQATYHAGRTRWEM